MVLVCVSWNSTINLLFFGLKVNSKTYKKQVEKELLPDSESIMKRNKFVFIRDSAPSYCSNLVEDF